MPVVLAISPDQTDEVPLRQRLLAAGCEAPAWAPCDAMVQKVAEIAPLQVVVWLPAIRRGAAAVCLQGLAGALRGWGTQSPCSLLLWLGQADDAELAPVAGLVEAGLHGLLVGEHGAARLQQELRWAQARWQREAALMQSLARTRGQLDDRKWVDRAKGVLMSARQIGEDEAFALLRGASMHANLRVGEVSRAVIAAAQWAEAMNRAGQLRMLSQRLAKLSAQRLAGIELRRTRSLQQQSLARVQDNLDHLAALPWLSAGGADASASLPMIEGLARSVASWQVLRAALADKASSLALIDQHAEALLLAAEDLTSALEAAAGRRALHIVNLCGRQRMRVQRAAKEALLAALLQQPARQVALQPVLDDFEVTLLELEAAPLSSPQIRAELLAARDEWGRLLRSLGQVEQAEGRALLARSSEALLEIFDHLTASYEHSLQVILG